MEMSLILKIGREAPAGAMLILAEPDLNEVYDLLLLQPERWADITRVPLCTAHTFSECFALCSADRPKLLQQSLDQFRELTAKVITSGLTSLRDPENEQKLDELLIINPNLLSAKVLQTAAQKRMPTVLSKGGSLRVLQQLGEPMLKAGSKQYPLKVAWTNKLEPSPWASARTRVDRLRPLLYPDAKLYADALSDLAKIYDGMVMNFSTNPQTREDVKRRVAEVRKRLKLAGGLLEEKTASAAESAGELLSDGLGDF